MQKKFAGSEARSLFLPSCMAFEKVALFCVNLKQVVSLKDHHSSLTSILILLLFHHQNSSLILSFVDNCCHSAFKMVLPWFLHLKSRLCQEHLFMFCLFEGVLVLCFRTFWLELFIAITVQASFARFHNSHYPSLAVLQ